MSHIISLYSSLVFLLIHSGCLSVKDQLRIVFFNGFNIIRCSDDQVQVYDYEVGKLDFIDDTLICPTKDKIKNLLYIGLLWKKVILVCSSNGSQVHEEIYLQKIIPSYTIVGLPEVISQVDPSTPPAISQVEEVDSTNLLYRIITDEQSTTAWSSTHTSKGEQHIVYFWFDDYTVICRVVYSTQESNPCPSPLHEQEANVTDATCFYDPNADHVPTITEFELELNQVDAAEKPTGDNKYLLDLDIPVRSRQRHADRHRCMFRASRNTIPQCRAMHHTCPRLTRNRIRKKPSQSRQRSRSRRKQFQSSAACFYFWQ